MIEQPPNTEEGEKLPAVPRRRGRAVIVARELSHEEYAAQLRVLEQAAAALNTVRSYSSGVQQFLDWGGLLPTDEETVLRYLVQHSQRLNPRTLSHRLSALAKWHAQQGFRDPTIAPRVRQTLAGIQRLYGRPKRQAKALPIEGLEQIARVLTSDPSLSALRDNALLQMGFLGGFRRSELVAISVADLVWETEGLTVVLPRSKTDQVGDGLLRAIPYGPAGGLCAATALRAWLHASGIVEGPVFRPITRTGHVRNMALGAGSVTDILVLRAQQAGLPHVPDLSAHSLRRGMATSAYRAGASGSAIKRQGGWKRDETVQGYIEEVDRFEDNVAKAMFKPNKG